MQSPASCYRPVLVTCWFSLLSSAAAAPLSVCSHSRCQVNVWSPGVKSYNSMLELALVFPFWYSCLHGLVSSQHLTLFLLLPLIKEEFQPTLTLAFANRVLRSASTAREKWHIKVFLVSVSHPGVINFTVWSLDLPKQVPPVWFTF